MTILARKQIIPIIPSIKKREAKTLTTLISQTTGSVTVLTAVKRQSVNHQSYSSRQLRLVRPAPIHNMVLAINYATNAHF